MSNYSYGKNRPLNLVHKLVFMQYQGLKNHKQKKRVKSQDTARERVMNADPDVIPPQLFCVWPYNTVHQ
jgi:hypothetical protein